MQDPEWEKKIQTENLHGFVTLGSIPTLHEQETTRD